MDVAYSGKTKCCRSDSDFSSIFHDFLFKSSCWLLKNNRCSNNTHRPSSVPASLSVSAGCKILSSFSFCFFHCGEPLVDDRWEPLQQLIQEHKTIYLVLSWSFKSLSYINIYCCCINYYIRTLYEFWYLI